MFFSYHSFYPPPPPSTNTHTFPFLSLQLPDTASQELYADSQLLVWAIVGLSELVSASYSEDSYGVVQRVRDVPLDYYHMELCDKIFCP